MHAAKPAPHATAVRAHSPPYATVAPAHPPPHASVLMHAVVRLVPADAHLVLVDALAGGDHPRPLRLPRSWGPLSSWGPPPHAPASYAC